MKYLRYGIAILTFLLVLFLVFKLFDKKDAKELISDSNEIRVVEKEEVLKIKEGMTYEEIIKKLGKTNDLKNDSIEYHIVRYHVGEDEITFVFKDYNEKTKLSGKEILERSRPINPEKAVMTGTVTNITSNDFTLKSDEKEVRVIITPATEFSGMSSILEIKEKDEVEVTFEREIDLILPYEGNAITIRKR